VVLVASNLLELLILLVLLIGSTPTLIDCLVLLLIWLLVTSERESK
jgi:hypothetical protein